MKTVKWLWLFFVVSLILATKVNAEVVIGDRIDIYVGEGNQTDQSVAYDSINKRFLAGWYEGTESTVSFYGQLVNVDGSLYGGRITIYQITDNSALGSSKVAFDPVNQRFLVVWGWVHLRQPEYIWVAETYGQFINTDGSLSGEDFRISPDPFEIEIFKLYPQDIIFDTIGNRFFVLINSGDPAPYQLYGQFVTTNGPLGDLFQITNFTSGYGAWYAKVGYDSNNNRFLVAYGNGSDGDIYGRLLNADGAPYTEEFIISDTGEPGGGNNIASLPFDPFNNRFLAVFNRAWWLHNVEGQFINADGSLYGEPIRILTYQDSNGAIFDSVNKKFLVVGTYSGTWGQLLNTDGSLFGSSFLITNDWNPYPPVLAGESLSSGILAVCSVDLGYGTDRDIVGRLVQMVNNPPELELIGDKEVDEDQLLEFTLYAADLDNDDLSFSAANLPTGATFIDNHDNTATFSWLPTYEQAGTYRYIHFEVTDGIAIDEEDITITVNNVNRDPVLNPVGDKEVYWGELLTFEISGYDLDGDQLSINSPDLPPEAILIDNGDGTATFSWRLRYYHVGGYNSIFTLPYRKLIGYDNVIERFPWMSMKCNVTFQISDGEFSDEEVIAITIKPKKF